ncbi:MAG: N-acetylmuramoyl-L-alanine amidase [Bacteroidales bacterium]|jgi:N-acetylmuramoyl-L-alanine amidase|nr:N-acetylmuramoyl-L-alanine amidase [Bacteroidales bacterium]
MEFFLKKIYLIQIIFLILLTPAFAFAQKSGGSVKTLVIDAGHGGNDPGATGKKSKEKDIALSVALKLGSLVKQGFPDVKVIYTRNDDRFVELHERSKLANKNKADLFISIHCNSADNKDARGVETWVMGMHKSDINLRVAQKENAAILKEQNYEKNYENFDPNSPDAYIIFSMYQNAYLDQSISFAQKLQEQYRTLVKSPNRGVFQAGFVVLWGCALPSVLTEIGFISNPDEEKFLMSDSGQTAIATSLLNAFREYKYQVEGNVTTSDNKPVATTKSTTPDNKPVATTKSTTPAVSTKAGAVDSTNNKVIFKVQFASSSIDKPLNSSEFSALQNVSKYSENGVFKYCSGEEADLARAKDLLKSIQTKGFRDAFVVAFRGGKRISLTEALKEN